MLDFHTLYTRHSAEVRRFALYLCGNPALADDIASETFVRAWVARGRIREATVRSYLFTIARNVHRDLARGTRRRPETALPDAIVDQGAGPERQLAEQDELAAVLAALQQLDETDRAALLMRAFDEMPYADIASALDISVVAAKVKVHRARARLMRARTPLEPSFTSTGGRS